jgi:hypothetical protein
MTAQQYSATGRVKGGQLYLRSRRQMDRALAAWKDCEISFTIEKVHATRSHAQNAYFHAVVVAMVSDRTGYTPNEAKELLKAKCLPHDLAEQGINGRVIDGLVIGGSTAKLDKLQFIDFLDECVRYAAEHMDLVIPDPDPQWREHAIEERAKQREVA